MMVLSHSNPFSVLEDPSTPRNLQELVSQITLAVCAEVKGEVERAVEEKLARKFDDLDEGARWIYFHHGIRNIEDFCIKRMKKMLNIPTRTDITYSEIVDRFHAKFNYAGVSKSDLMSLKDSKSRTIANTIFHLDVQSDAEVSRIWRLIQPTFREDAQRKRYERLLQFGRARTVITKKAE